MVWFYIHELSLVLQPFTSQLCLVTTFARGSHVVQHGPPDLVRVAVLAPTGNSDHSSLLAVISMARAVPNLCVSMKVFLIHLVDCNPVCGAI